MMLIAGGLALVVAGRAVRTVVRAKATGLMEHMMECVMPRMMDACFAQMSPERRQFMLAHCRGLLDDVEAKYGSAEAEAPFSEPAPGA